jgi:hypothetical protein
MVIIFINLNKIEKLTGALDTDILFYYRMIVNV